MKKVLFVSILLIASAMTAMAQDIMGNPGRLEKEKAGLLLDGRQVTDQEIMEIIGRDVYFDTFVGARKQIKAGKVLCIAGGAGIVTGFAEIFAGAYDYVNEERSEEEISPIFALGYLTAILGATALEAGIPLCVIGSSRMRWIANDYNERSSRNHATLNVGMQKYGFGIALRF